MDCKYVDFKTAYDGASPAQAPPCVIDWSDRVEHAEADLRTTACSPHDVWQTPTTRHSRRGQGGRHTYVVYILHLICW
jgi:hypothetical protein